MEIVKNILQKNSDNERYLQNAYKQANFRNIYVALFIISNPDSLRVKIIYYHQKMLLMRATVQSAKNSSSITKNAPRRNAVKIR